MDLYNWLRCEELNGNEDHTIVLVNKYGKTYQILVNDSHSRDWIYMVPTSSEKPVYYQISYLLKDVDKKLLGGYYVTNTREVKTSAPFLNGVYYEVTIDEMAPANQLKKKGDNRDMETLYDWLKCKIKNGRGDLEVSLMYDNFLLGYPKKACIKESRYGRFGSVLSTDFNDTKEKERCTIDSLFFNNRVDFLSDYYITMERMKYNDLSYELTVTDKLSMLRKKDMENSVYGIKPKIPAYINPLPIDQMSEDDCFSLRKELSRIALDGIWKADKKRLEIEKVTLNGPATVIFWKDGTKTVVKCDKDDIPDYEKGILYAVIKKLCNKKEYDDILRLIDAWDEYNNVCPDLFPDNAEVEKPEKPKKKVYKHHFGDSDKKCPHCGQNWIWTRERRKTLRDNGHVNITCRNCGHRFKYIIGGGTYESQ